MSYAYHRYNWYSGMVELRKTFPKACNSLRTFPLELRNALWDVVHWHDSCGFHRRAAWVPPIHCSKNVLWKRWNFDRRIQVTRAELELGRWRAAGLRDCGKIAGFYFNVLKIPIKKLSIWKLLSFFALFAANDRERPRTTANDAGDPAIGENGEMDYGNWNI